MKINRRIIFSTALLLFLTVGVIGALAIPTALKIKELTGKIDKHQGEIERRYALRNYVKKTFAELSTAESQLKTVRQTYIHEENEINFIQDMEQAANMAGVEQTLDLNMDRATEITLWDKSIPISVQVSGPFPKVMSWLNEVEHLDYYVLFNSFNMHSTHTTRGMTPNRGNVKAVFSGKVYWISKKTPYFLDFEQAMDLMPDNTTMNGTEKDEET